MLRIAHEALTFDDVLLVPAYSKVLPSEVDLATRLTRDIALNIPLVSAAMDTVTESRLAIAVAQEGGIGIVHKNMPLESQAREVRAVKKFETGVIRDPIVIAPEATVRELLELTSEHRISGVPVVRGNDLVGIVTARDIRFESRLDAPVSTVMTPKERLVTAGEDAPLAEVTELLHQHRIEKVLLVNEGFELKGMVTVKDIAKSQAYPNACKDERGQLRTGASVGTGEDTDDRVAALVEAGADIIVVDTAHGHSQRVLDRISWIKQKYPAVPVMGGNIATGDGARGASRRRGGCGQGGHRTRQHLHDAGGHRRRRAAGHGGLRGGRASRGGGCARDRRWRRALLRRHRQGHQCRRLGGHGRFAVRGYRGGAGRNRALPGPHLQGLPGHGLARCAFPSERYRTSTRTATSRNP